MILNYTTKVPADKTAGEIVRTLALKGAAEVHQRFTNGKPRGIAFAMLLHDQMVYFELPVNVEGVHEHMKARSRNGTADRSQSERIAWRIVKDWVEVQIAIVESGQAEMTQVFLPYAIEPGGTRTVFEVFRENSKKRLGGDSSAQRLTSGTELQKGEHYAS